MRNIMEKWYKKSFYRNLVDMHIPDTDSTYLSKFDSEEYARTVASSGADTATEIPSLLI